MLYDSEAVTMPGKTKKLENRKKEITLLEQDKIVIILALKRFDGNRIQGGFRKAQSFDCGFATFGDAPDINRLGFTRDKIGLRARIPFVKEICEIFLSRIRGTEHETVVDIQILSVTFVFRALELNGWVILVPGQAVHQFEEVPAFHPLGLVIP